MTLLTDKQLEQIYNIVESFCRENNWPFDERTKGFIVQMDQLNDISPDEYFFCISTADGTDEGDVIGLMVGQISAHPFSNVKIATEWFVYSSVPGLGKDMLADFQEWANNHGADVIYATAPTRSVEYWLQSQGYKFKEAAYIKWLA